MADQSLADLGPPDDLVSPPDDLIETPEAKPQSTSLGAFSRGAAKGAAPAIGGFGAGVATAAAAQPVIAPIAGLTGPLAPATEAVLTGAAGLAGGFGGGYLVNKAQDWALSKLPESVQKTLGVDKAQEQTDVEQHPYASLTGNIIPNLALMRPSAIANDVRQGASLASRLWRSPAAGRVLGAGLQGGMEAGQEEAEQGTVDPWKVGIAAGAGALMNKPTALGERVAGVATLPQQVLTNIARGRPAGERVEPTAGSAPAQQPPADLVPEGGTAPAQPSGGAPAPGEAIGLRYKAGPPRRATVDHYFDNGNAVRLRLDDGTYQDLTVADMAKNRTEAPEPMPTSAPPARPGEQLTPDERPVPPLDLLDEGEPYTAPRRPQEPPANMLGGDMLNALDHANSLERTALNQSLQLSGAARQDMLAEAARLRRLYGHDETTASTPGYTHPLAGEPAADLGELAAARVAKPELYESQRAVPPPTSNAPAAIDPYAIEDILRSRAPLPKNPTIFDAIRDLGGIKPDSDIAQIMDGYKNPPFKRRVVNPNGMDADKVREALQQEGWFGTFDNQFGPTALEAGRYPGDDIRDLHNLMDREARGNPQYHPESTTTQELQWRQLLDEDLARAGVSANDSTEEAALKLQNYRRAESARQQEYERDQAIYNHDETPSPDLEDLYGYEYEPGADIGAEHEEPGSPEEGYPRSEGEREGQGDLSGEGEFASGPHQDAAEEPAGERANRRGSLDDIQFQRPPSDLFSVEPGALDAQGNPVDQTVIPGAEALSPEEMQRRDLERRANAPKRGTAGQKGVQGFGLFDPEAALEQSVEERQQSLFQRANPKDVRDLIVQHNISAAKLAHADRLGGLAAPSLAITKADHPLTGFGDITLLGHRDMANPRLGAKVFGADVYSPRYPTINYKLDNAALKALDKVLSPFFEEGERHIYSSDVNRPEDLRGIPAFERYAKEASGEKYPDYEAIGKELLQKVGATERIFRGFNNNGNRTYTPHTLENVVRILKKDIRGGENWNYGVGSLRAKFTPQFRTVESIRSAKGKLVPKEKFEELKKEVDTEFWGVADTLKPYYKYDRNAFGFGDTVVDALGDAAKQGLPRALREYGFEDVPQDAVLKAASFLGKLRNFPTEYFEAKLLRGVGLPEFHTAVIPDNASESTRAILKKRGIQTAEYKAGDAADRQRVIGETARNAADEVMFQRGQETAAQPRGEQIKLSDNILARTVENPTPDEVRLLNEIEKVAERIVPSATVRTMRSLHMGEGARRQMGVSDTTVHGVTYSNGLRRLIAVSLESPNPVATLGHETIHYLKGRGLISPKEWSALEKAADKSGWLDKHGIPDRYPNGSERLQREEAIAEEFSKWRRAPNNVPKMFRPMYERVSKFMAHAADAARRLFGRDVTAEDVMSRINTGEVGRRQRSDVERQEPRFQRHGDQTETPEFKRWFGNSKVIDKDGNPLRVYHGTNADIAEFHPNIDGMYFSSSPEIADQYAHARQEDLGGHGINYPVYLSIKNPLVVEGSDAYSDLFERRIEEAMDGGYDGVHFKNVRDGWNVIDSPIADTWVAFNPDQIKSAIGNRGTFAPADSRINYQMPKDANEAGDRMDNAADQMASELGGQAPGTYRRSLDRMMPPMGEMVFKDPNAVQNVTLRPETLARLDSRSAAVWNAEKAKEYEANSMVDDLRSRISDTMLKLNDTQRNNVYAARELDRINGMVRQDTGHQIVARNEGADFAHFSKPGQVITLSPEETTAYHGLTGMFDRAWKNIAEGAARKVGWNGGWDKDDMAANIAHLNHVAETTMDDKGLARVAQRAAKIVSALEEQRKQGYHPLMRFGDYYAHVTPKTGTDMSSTGGFPKTVRFELAERGLMDGLVGGKRVGNEAPPYAKEMLDRLNAQYPADKYRIEHGFLAKNPDMLDRVDIPAIEKLMTFMENDMLHGLRQEARGRGLPKEEAAADARKRYDELYGAMVDRLWDHAFKELEAGYKKKAATVPGYSPDFDRALGTYMHWTSRNVADQIHRNAIDEAHTAMATDPRVNSDVKRYWRNWKEYQQSPSNIFNKSVNGIARWGFLTSMGVNPSSTAVVGTHGLFMAGPTLSVGIGMNKAAPAYSKAMAHAMGAVTVDRAGLHIPDVRAAGRTPDERAYLAKLDAEGALHSRAIEDMAALNEKQSSLWGSARSTARKVMDAALSNVSVMDRANRIASALSAYRLAGDPKTLATMNKAWDSNQIWREKAAREGISRETMAKFMLSQMVGEYGKANQAPIERNAFSRMMLGMQGFVTRLLQSMWKLGSMGPEGQKALLWTLGAFWLMAGTNGVPFSEDVQNLGDYLWKKATGKDPMLAYRIQAELASVFGKSGADMVLHGPVSSLTGADVASRLGLGDLVTRNWPSPENTLGAYPSIILGRAMGAVSNLRSGQPEAAAAQLLPGGLRNAAMAGIEREHGIKSRAGKVEVPAAKITPADTVSRALGFTPEKAEQQYRETDYQIRRRQAHMPAPPDVIPRYADGGHVHAAANEADPEPTQAQIEAGNYRKGHLSLHGFDITVETPKGVARRGVGADGKPWENSHKTAHYGYIRSAGPVAADGEHVDCYIGPHHESRRIYIVDQVDPKTRRWDEHKIVFGVRTIKEAKTVYDGGFSDASGPRRRAHVHEVTPEGLKHWLDNGQTERPYTEAA